MTIERFQELADMVTADIPTEFFHKLNGGIVLLEQAKLHPESRPGAPLYVMGEFTFSHMMGRHILLYYGSFEASYPHLDEEAMKGEIRKVILHEFTHHLESLGLTRELEKEDMLRLERYRARFD